MKVKKSSLTRIFLLFSFCLMLILPGTSFFFGRQEYPMFANDWLRISISNDMLTFNATLKIYLLI